MLHHAATQLFHIMSSENLLLLKKLRDGFRLDLVGNLSASLDATIKEVATLISSCYGYVTQEMMLVLKDLKSQKKCSGPEKSTTG